MMIKKRNSAASRLRLIEPFFISVGKILERFLSICNLFSEAEIRAILSANGFHAFELEHLRASRQTLKRSRVTTLARVAAPMTVLQDNCRSRKLRPPGQRNHLPAVLKDGQGEPFEQAISNIDFKSGRAHTTGQEAGDFEKAADSVWEVNAL